MKELHPLAGYRKQRKLTQEQLAELLDVTSVSISRWETGERKIGLAKLSEVSEKTGIPKRELRPDLVGLINEGRE